jgi:hypothetical protein
VRPIKLNLKSNYIKIQEAKAIADGDLKRLEIYN